MKIALVRKEFGGIGGGELYLQRLMEALIDKGNEVVLITSDKRAQVDGVTMRVVTLSAGRAKRVMEFDRKVREMLAGVNFDCIFSLERLGEQDVLRAGDGVHSVWLEQRRRFLPSWRSWLVGYGGFHQEMLELEACAYDVRNTRRIIVNSEMIGRNIQERFGYPAERIHLVRNGVEIDRWQGGERDATRKLWGVEPDEFLLLFAGSGWERKGLRYVVSAMERLNDSSIKLVVAGKGRPPNWVSSKVQFVGPMRDIENAYAAADLFVFPTIYEPSANVCFEALAAGLPVVTSAYNGAAEVIEEGINGTVVTDPSDTGALASSIEFWRERPNVRPVPVKANLSLERNVRETLAVLELAAAERAVE